jgi:tRNA(fMet)-specific endonuclease VapC
MVQRLSQAAPTDCAVSMVSVYELFCGLAKAQDPAKERRKVERFISAVIELPLDRASAEAAAKIRGELEQEGKLIGPYDLLIAGQALAGGLTLVTNNLREFQRVSGLNLQSWP